MTKLTQPQTALLKAAATDEGAQASTETAKTAAALIQRGLLISIPRPDAPSRLTITAAGREAIGAPAPQAAPSKSARRAKGRAAGPAAATEPAAPTPKGKLGVLVDLLRRPEGAGIDELVKATGWQAHSVRGAISGAVKKKLKLTVTSEKTETGRVYRIVAGSAA